MPIPQLRFRGKFSQHLALRFMQMVWEETPAFKHLRKLFLKGAVSAHDWARHYGQEGTWIEEFGNATLEGWRKYPESLEPMIPYPHFPANNAGALDERVEICEVLDVEEEKLISFLTW